MLRLLTMSLSACAYLVAPDHHLELQHATRVALTCPDVAPGSYVVEVIVTDQPYRVTARVASSPPLSTSTQRCVELAFATQRYGLIRGTETLTHPFVLMDGGP